MTDNSATCELYEWDESSKCNLYTWALDKKEGAKYYLHVLKHGKMFELLDSDEDISGNGKKSCVSYDSFFKVLSASKEVFDV